MSSRERLFVAHGVDAAVELYRDDDSQTYRLFIEQGRQVIGNVDLTAKQLMALGLFLADVLERHDPWPELEERA